MNIALFRSKAEYLGRCSRAFLLDRGQGMPFQTMTVRRQLNLKILKLKGSLSLGQNRCLRIIAQVILALGASWLSA